MATIKKTAKPVKAAAKKKPVPKKKVTAPPPPAKKAAPKPKAPAKATRKKLAPEKAVMPVPPEVRTTFRSKHISVEGSGSMTAIADEMEAIDSEVMRSLMGKISKTEPPLSATSGSSVERKKTLTVVMVSWAECEEDEVTSGTEFWERLSGIDEWLKQVLSIDEVDPMFCEGQLQRPDIVADIVAGMAAHLNINLSQPKRGGSEIEPDTVKTYYRELRTGGYVRTPTYWHILRFMEMCCRYNLGIRIK